MIVLIFRFSSWLSALILLIVSIETKSMLVSEVARALKLILFCMIREYYPRMDPETVI